MAFEYVGCGWPVSERVAGAHRRSWERLASAGFWWTGAERVAIAEECRRAAALGAGSGSTLGAGSGSTLEGGSGSVLEGESGSGRESGGGAARLPEAAVYAVQKIVVDNANLSREWVEEVCAAEGMSDAHYIELLGVLVHVFSIDELHRALDIPLEPLPLPLAGEPSRRRPSGARQGDGWLAITPPDALDAEDEGLYEGAPFAANVLTALSLVPGNLPWLADLSHAHYLSYVEMRETGKLRGIDRAQQELIASRVSVLNECFY